MEITCKVSQTAFYLFVIILQFIWDKKSVMCSEVDTVNPPEIFLEQYKLEKSNWWVSISNESYFPDFLSKDGQDYIVSNNTSSPTASHLLLSCRSLYPIYWETMTKVQPTLMDEIKTHFKVVLDFDDDEEQEGAFNTTQLEAKEFWSYLILYNHVSFTGLYTCQSVEDENLKTSTYAFLSGLSDNTQVLLQAGQNIMVGVNGQQSVLLPCKVSQPNVGISVSKKDTDGNWTLLTLNTKFDPKKGWTVNKSDVTALTGHYKCAVAEEEFIVDVRNNYQEGEEEFSVKNYISGSAKWYIDNSSVFGYIYCCSNSTEPPDLIVMECDNIPHCKMREEAFMRLNTNETSDILTLDADGYKWAGDPCMHTRQDKYKRSFIIQCTGDGIDILGRYVMEFRPPTYQQMGFVPSTSIQNISYNEKAAIQTKFYKWENFTITTGFFYGIEISETDLYSGEQLLIDCCGVHSFHASGRSQRIVWENGTVTTLKTHEQIADNDRPYMVDFCWTYNYGWNEEQLMDYIVILQQNMSYFECIVPRWYTKQPGIQRILLDVKESKEPVILQNVNADDDKANVIYTENQLGLLELKCEVYEGAPPPLVTWSKDGYEINQTDLYWSAVDASDELSGPNLLFMRATKEIEGKYECTAANWKGFDTRTFIVQVTPRSYLDYWAAFVVFGGFFAMILCCGVRISTLEKQMTSKKQVDPMNTPQINLSKK